MRGQAVILVSFLAGIPVCGFAQDERVVLGRSEVLRWEFDAGADGWTPAIDAEAAEPAPGVLRLHSRGIDPSLLGPPVALDASVNGHLLRVRMKAAAGDSAQFFWADDAQPAFDEERSARFEITPDGRFHDYELSLIDRPRWTGRITHLRFDPTVAAGDIEIDRIAIEEVRFHPLSLGPGVQESAPDGFRVGHKLSNVSPREVVVQVSATVWPESADPAFRQEVKIEGLRSPVKLPAGETANLDYAVKTSGTGIFPVDVTFECEGVTLHRHVTVRNYPALNQIKRIATWGIEAGDFLGTCHSSGPDAFSSFTLYVDRPGGAFPAVDLDLAGHLIFDLAGRRSEAFVFGAVPPADIPGSDRELLSGKARLRDGTEVGAWQWDIAYRPRGVFSLTATFTPSRDLKLARADGIVVRLPGRSHDQALLSGLEFLGKNESSSSTLDIETPERVRIIPDPLKVTMPLMGVVKDGTAIGLAWSLPTGTKPEDRIVQPSFSVPNAVDGEPNCRMSLMLPAVGQGRKENAWEAEKPIELKAGESITISAKLYVLPGADLGGLVSAWLKDNPLPAPPAAPRDDAAAWDIVRRAYLDSELYDPEKKGWGHCAEKSWARQPFGDHLGYLWKLGLMGGERVGGPKGPPHREGKGLEAARVREVLAAHPAAADAGGGGAHIRSRIMPFTLGDPLKCLAAAKAHAEALIATQRPDGLWTYEGKYRRGHFEDTASGLCGANALAILDYAKMSLDRKAIEAGHKALEAMKRFRTPRGAQTWELSLHTPDILASAHLVGAYVRGYELTKDPALLERARYWALTGVPFVYLWDRADLPVMRYSTIAVYGATNWAAPNWMGLPVQWCGEVYAGRLLELAPYDTTVDWRRLAEGITVAAEQMLNPDGPQAGCLPDSFNLARQHRNGPMINPGATAALRLPLLGERYDAETDIATWDGKPVAVTTVARDVTGGTDAEKRLVLRGRFHRGAQYYWVFAGCPAVSEVMVNGAVITKVDAWPADGAAWRAVDGWLIVRIVDARESDEIRLR